MLKNQVTRKTAMPPSQRRDQILKAHQNQDLGALAFHVLNGRFLERERVCPFWETSKIKLEGKRTITCLPILQRRELFCTAVWVVLKVCHGKHLRSSSSPEGQGCWESQVVTWMAHFGDVAFQLLVIFFCEVFLKLENCLRCSDVLSSFLAL